MARKLPYNFSVRRNFGKIDKILDFPSLIEIQRTSYESFLQKDIPPNKREDVGLQSVFNDIFPIKDFNKQAALEFVSYSLDPPKHDVDECRQRGMTYSAPMKITVRLVVYQNLGKEEPMEQRPVLNVKEQEVYFGEIPLMTENGTFIVNGTERVVVSQLHRSPGAFFEHDKGKTHASEKLIYAARINPYRGSWLDFEFDLRDILHVRIDRRRKMHATILLRALGYAEKELLDYFYNSETVRYVGKGRYEKELNFDILKGQTSTRDIKDQKTGKILVAKNRKFTERALQRMKELGITEIDISAEELFEKILAEDCVNSKTGEVIAKCNTKIDKKLIEELHSNGIDEFRILFIDKINVGSYLRDTLAADGVSAPEEAWAFIYKRMRPGEPVALDKAKVFFDNLFFNPERYDLSQVGRLKMNHKFGLDEPLTSTILTKKDIMEVVKYLIELKNGRGGLVDDIDHLGNRRVRPVGELIENQFRAGLVRMERAIKEKMMTQEVETLLPHDLINSKPVNAVVKEFFGSSQLSQFMDQTNPLSEITHKRRLSALGPGGLTRERAGFEVRDVHPTHYGRICPIETPEGPNIGLIASLATYARVTKYGFVETPYRTVKDGAITKEVKYYSALEEEKHTIAQANTQMDKKGRFVQELIAARQKQGDLVMVQPQTVSLMDVSPNQLVSVAAALIPFLEHDDANRALMGSNMQRQAVPLLRTESPLVGTGIEGVVARDSGIAIVAKRSGTVQAVDSTRIVIKVEKDKVEEFGSVDVYPLVKFQRSNQSTCLNQKPIVRESDRVEAGQIIADGAATAEGELALGCNMVVAFMPWGGYNFEDSILINERAVREDSFSSIHIEEFECIARNTKLGDEEITRDIPNVGEEMLRNLDESGIVRIGAEVKPGDILVGKITPKGESQLSPEEKLLRAIFGEKAGEVRDTSLKVPPGVEGTVIGARVFLRKGVEKDDRSLAIERAEEDRIKKEMNDKISVTKNLARERVIKLLDGQEASARLTYKGKVVVQKGAKLDSDALNELDWQALVQITIDDDKKSAKIADVVKATEEQVALFETVYGEKIKRLKKGDELPPGVIKMVKVYIAMKRKLQVGDKMAGRHGNKGVISRILPEEDMPYLANGTPVDIVLNPLGVPSRMNVGQVFETHFGWAAYHTGKQIHALIDQGPKLVKKALQSFYTDVESKALVEGLSDDQVIELAQRLRNGVKVATPVFDGATEEDIFDLLEKVGVEKYGRTTLFDGRTGEPFSDDVTVGVMYMLKLHHLVEDKIHARATGPYSLVTQQPLGGKAQFGGQRLGEMEVWALEAYGAAYALREFMTVKSDDIGGRTKMFESIVKGERKVDLGLPESFNVLVKEMQSLGLDMEMMDESPAEAQ